ncbi:hypothetical protein B0H13DRAFT_1870584 [Mycena leptocephala]|nr:hypothetical protein B0H13DRAFT_1870584 [Mycena leptocephala]
MNHLTRAFLIEEATAGHREWDHRRTEGLGVPTSRRAHNSLKVSKAFALLLRHPTTASAASPRRTCRMQWEPFLTASNGSWSNMQPVRLPIAVEMNAHTSRTPPGATCFLCRPSLFQNPRLAPTSKTASGCRRNERAHLPHPLDLLRHYNVYRVYLPNCLAYPRTVNRWHDADAPAVSMAQRERSRTTPVLCPAQRQCGADVPAVFTPRPADENTSATSTAIQCPADASTYAHHCGSFSMRCQVPHRALCTQARTHGANELPRPPVLVRSCPPATFTAATAHCNASVPELSL